MAKDIARIGAIGGLGAAAGGATATLHPDVEKTKKNISEAAALGLVGGLSLGVIERYIQSRPDLQRRAEEQANNLFRGINVGPGKYWRKR